MSYAKRIMWRILCIVLFLYSGSGIKLNGAERVVLDPVSFENIFIDDFYWYFHFRSQRTNTLPTVWHRLIENGVMKGKYTPGGVEDGDLFQLLETMAYISFLGPDSVQRVRMDSLAALIPESASRDLNFTVLKKRRKNAHPRDYQLAAFYRASLAYTRAGGQRLLLDWALQNAELLSRQVLEAPEKIQEKNLHPNMALALGDLFRLTRNSSFLKAAQIMLQKMQVKNWGMEQGYYEAAEAWIGALAGNQQALEANSQRWQKLVSQNMRITGGFSVDSVTGPCTRFSLWESMADMEWCLRLYEALQDARYMELYERILYNELRSGISFYGGFVSHDLQDSYGEELQRDTISQVPLEQLIPLVRNMAVLPDYYYSTQNDTAIYINQYFRGEVTIRKRNLNLKLSTMSSMPWNGGFYMDILTDKPVTCTFYLRMPGWIMDEYIAGCGPYRYLPQKQHIRLAVNGYNCPIEVENGFLKLSGTWKNNDRIIFNFLSSVRKIVPRDICHTDTQCLAYQRGPFLFSLEQPDSLMRGLDSCRVDYEEGMGVSFALGLMGGVQVLTGNLYERQADTLQKYPFQVLPYFSRGQRGSAKVKIWFPYFIKRKAE